MLNTLELVKNTQSKRYSDCGLTVENFLPEAESADYYAHTFTIKNRKGLFRIAKKTPTKEGWFVTIWQRNSDNNIITPYHETAGIDFLIIAVVDRNNVGEFIFPKTILLNKHIFSSMNKEGKRAFRVYTPWDSPPNAQAAQTQKWQSQFFVDLSMSCKDSLHKISKLYTM